jgi:hypothetical protein
MHFRRRLLQFVALDKRREDEESEHRRHGVGEDFSDPFPA